MLIASTINSASGILVVVGILAAAVFMSAMSATIFKQGVEKHLTGSSTLSEVIEN